MTSAGRPRRDRDARPATASSAAERPDSITAPDSATLRLAECRASGIGLQKIDATIDIRLRSGGTVRAVVANVDLAQLSDGEAALVFGLLNRLCAYGEVVT